MLIFYTEIYMYTGSYILCLVQNLSLFYTLSILLQMSPDWGTSALSLNQEVGVAL